MAIRVLVVDDDIYSAQLLAVLLQLEGQHCKYVYTTEGLVDVAVRFKPDLVLMDVRMPGQNGYDTVKRLRQQSCLAAVPMAAVTGLVQAEDREEALAAGFNYHFTKPFCRETLQELLRGIRHASLERGARGARTERRSKEMQ